MSRYSHLPIFQKAYDLNLEIYKTTHNFPREYKYSLGQKIKEISGELLDCIVAANSEEDKGRHFPEIKARIERLRIQLRTAYDLKIIISQRLEFLSRLLEEISKQTAGWEKWFFEKKQLRAFRRSRNFRSIRPERRTESELKIVAVPPAFKKRKHQAWPNRTR